MGKLFLKNNIVAFRLNCITFLDTFMNQVLRNMSFLKANLLQIREDMSSILLSNNAPQNEVASFLQTCSLPVNNEEQLVEVEHFLHEKEHFLHAVRFKNYIFAYQN